MHRTTDEFWSQTKHQLGLAYFIDQNPQNYPKMGGNKHGLINYIDFRDQFFTAVR